MFKRLGSGASTCPIIGRERHGEASGGHSVGEPVKTVEEFIAWTKEVKGGRWSRLGIAEYASHIKYRRRRIRKADRGYGFSVAGKG